MTPLQRALSEGRLTHGAWTRTDEDGRELLCVLAAMSPEVAVAQDAAACPAHIAPAWLAHLLPWVADAGTDAARPAVWARVADLQSRWASLWPHGWPEDISRRADARVRRAAVVAARCHATERERPAVDAVVSLLDRRIEGDEPSQAAVAAAVAAARAARATAQAASAAAAVVEASAVAVARAASWASEAAAWEAAAAADALTVEVLDIIADEITRGEHRSVGGT